MAEQLNIELEEKVEKRTKEISGLLNNLENSIFSVRKDLRVHPPFSQYSETLFKKNIEGKNIYDTVFNYYESSSQLLSTLQFNLACSFGSDDVQWDMIKENNPEKISFKSNDGLLKNLKISLTPLWNDDSLLEKIMFVIETN